MLYKLHLTAIVIKYFQFCDNIYIYFSTNLLIYLLYYNNYINVLMNYIGFFVLQYYFSLF